MDTTPFDIEKDLPIPEVIRRSKYPFGKMFVGDSFFADNRIAGTAAHVWASKHQGVKFAARAEGDGTRVWRLA